MTFRVGQKVVCVDASQSHVAVRHLRSSLVLNAVYTIRSIDIWEDVTGVRLEEIIDPVLDVWLDREPTEPVWRPSRFRPIAESKTEISFTIGADPSTNQFDNRRKVRKKVAI